MPNSLSAEVFQQILSERIKSAGRVTLAQFMEWALYDPTYGYYTRGPNIGPRGDFTTSPEASPAFGRLMAKHIVDIDVLLGQPTVFDLLECGPGRGTLAGDLLDELSTSNPGLYNRLQYHLVEISPALRHSQQERLGQKHTARVRWAKSLDELPDRLVGGIIGNEFIDAFPVHVLTSKSGHLKEQYVTQGEDNALKVVYDSPSSGDLQHFMERYSIRLADGESLEINLGSRLWFEQAARVLARGVVTLIDYGDIQPARYSPIRREGTLLGYYGGAVTHNVLEHPGEQDLTALVDFTALQSEAAEAGFEIVGLLRQAAFLAGLGLGTAISMLDGGSDVTSALDYRRGLQSLISMEGLGKFHVLVLGKGISPGDAKGALLGLQYTGLL